MTQEQIKSFSKHLIAVTTKSKDAISYRIKLNGQFITTNSRRTCWRRIGDAKNALRLHIETIYYRHYGSHQYISNQDYDDLIEYMLKEKILEFVPL